MRYIIIGFIFLFWGGSASARTLEEIGVWKNHRGEMYIHVSNEGGGKATISLYATDKHNVNKVMFFGSPEQYDELVEMILKAQERAREINRE